MEILRSIIHEKEEPLLSYIKRFSGKEILSKSANDEMKKYLLSLGLYSVIFAKYLARVGIVLPLRRVTTISRLQEGITSPLIISPILDMGNVGKMFLGQREVKVNSWFTSP